MGLGYTVPFRMPIVMVSRHGQSSEAQPIVVVLTLCDCYLVSVFGADAAEFTFEREPHVLGKMLNNKS